MSFDWRDPTSAQLAWLKGGMGKLVCPWFARQLPNCHPRMRATMGLH